MRKGKKQLIQAIGRNIYIINILKSVIQRVITVRATLGMVKVLLLSESKDISRINDLIETSNLLLESYSPHAEKYGQIDILNMQILDDLIDICLENDILRFDFETLDWKDLTEVEHVGERLAEKLF